MPGSKGIEVQLDATISKKIFFAPGRKNVWNVIKDKLIIIL